MRLSCEDRWSSRANFLFLVLTEDWPGTHGGWVSLPWSCLLSLPGENSTKNVYCAKMWNYIAHNKVDDQEETELPRGGNSLSYQFCFFPHRVVKGLGKEAPSLYVYPRSCVPSRFISLIWPQSILTFILHSETYMGKQKRKHRFLTKFTSK